MGKNGLYTKYDAQDSEIPSGDYTFYSRSGGTSAIDYIISSLSGLKNNKYASYTPMEGSKGSRDTSVNIRMVQHTRSCNYHN